MRRARVPILAFSALSALSALAACKESSRQKAAPAPRAAGTRATHAAAPRSATIPALPVRTPSVHRDVAVEDKRPTEALLGCADPGESCRAAAYGHVLAMKKQVALEVLPAPDPSTATPLPESVEAYIRALDHYAELAGPDDPETPGMQFLAAQTYGRYGWAGTALARYEAVIRQYPEREVSEYAANLLLDTLARTGQHDELCRWATELLADSHLLASKPELRATLGSILTRC